MGIKIEFNPDLALRKFKEHKDGKRKIEECIPEKLAGGETYSFLKKGQRIFWFNDDPFWSNGALPLVVTEGNEKLSKPIASIKMLEVTHFLEKSELYTKGKYMVVEVFNDDEIHFNGFFKI